jgi:uncharacterized protein
MEHYPSDFERQHGFSPLATLLLLILSMLLGSGIGNAINYLAGEAMGFPLSGLMKSFDEQSGLAERNLLRGINLIAQLCTFTFPAIMVAWLLYRSDSGRYLKLHRTPPSSMITAGIFFLLGILAVSQAVYWLNQQIPLPSWAGEMEDTASRMVKGLLVMNSPSELAFNLLVVAVVPALGEELVFRGIVQQKLEQASARPIAAIWMSAFIFSAFHLQFAGLLPRLLLGAGLGYLFYWTQSLWAPIIAHFFVNGLQIVAQYFKSKALPEASSIPDINWLGTAGAAFLVLILSFYLYQHRYETNRKAGQAEDAQPPTTS